MFEKKRCRIRPRLDAVNSVVYSIYFPGKRYACSLNPYLLISRQAFAYQVGETSSCRVNPSQ